MRWKQHCGWRGEGVEEVVLTGTLARVVLCNGMTREDRQTGSALEEWREVLRPEQVITGSELDAYLVNCLSITRRVLAALWPENESEVQAIVRIAARHEVRIYTFSTGHNWGYGTSMPVEDDCVLLDLSRLNRILQMDGELGLIRLEPGVTQGQLFEFLRENDHDFFVPTTGAGPSGSLLGNALDRGFGITPEEDHFGAVRSVRAVLADGSIYESSLASLGMPMAQSSWKWGIGPYLDGLFAQGNYGIVTAATLALGRRPEHIEVYVFTVDDKGSLPEVACRCRDAVTKLRGIAGGIKFMNQAQLKLTLDTSEVGMGLAPQFAWVGFGVLHCAKAMVKAARTELKKSLAPHLSQLIFLNDRRIQRFKRLAKFARGNLKKKIERQVQQGEDILQIVRGQPRALELRLVYQHVPEPPDGPKDPVKEGVGVIWYAPIIPLKQATIAAMVAAIQTTLRSYGFPEAISLTTVNERCAMGVIPIIYKRPEDRGNAHQCFDTLLQEGKKAGCFPYRLNVSAMATLPEDGPTFWKMARAIKDAVDPDHLLSPGRYGL
ncbi:MAG: linked oxidase domain protein [Candidatus Solibacter sp.]|nr:linked oxidase domain protein [Candidatus Solibacter sp.]